MGAACRGCSKPERNEQESVQVQSYKAVSSTSPPPVSLKSAAECREPTAILEDDEEDKAEELKRKKSIKAKAKKSLVSGMKKGEIARLAAEHRKLVHEEVLLEQQRRAEEYRDLADGLKTKALKGLVKDYESRGQSASYTKETVADTLHKEGISKLTAEEIVKLADADGDGKIGVDEFKDLVKTAKESQQTGSKARLKILSRSWQSNAWQLGAKMMKKKEKCIQGNEFHTRIAHSLLKEQEDDNEQQDALTGSKSKLSLLAGQAYVKAKAEEQVMAEAAQKQLDKICGGEKRNSTAKTTGGGQNARIGNKSASSKVKALKDKAQNGVKNVKQKAIMVKQKTMSLAHLDSDRKG
eukprot:gnl/TRDRNA2_/TRDRNA2_34056_c0_seq1.p1 gnl/TRDRNA2_/TRDRNA2_34056_c0~~gnl/TRDRNA2_/TRDRNA2_34056_c0_seq1.p1  ORF type:complete len:353 (-),score=87.81 gnl/TRDRNA2_/TRDRNA2_34056_c0_seq1:71-1129(-)